jgi:hypothetical protein
MDMNSDYLSVFISFASFVISIVAITFYFKDRKREKFALVNEYFKQLLEWHGETVEILISLRNSVSQDGMPERSVLMCKLSSQIEKGRFFFPNIDLKDDFGSEKPEAYQGYRNLAIDFLVYSYNLFSKKNPSHYLKHAENMQREFTSIVFQVVRPRKNLQEIKKLTNRFYMPSKIFEDYLEKNPDSIRFMHDRD